MNREKGFAFKEAAAIVLLLSVAACRNHAPQISGPPGGGGAIHTASSFPRVEFSHIQLPEARLTITRMGASPAPAEILNLKVKVAEDPESRGKGLMGVPSLPSSAGMVFKFDRPLRSSFYMENTLVPLDIAFWGEDRKIHEILHMTPCKATPCPLYQPKLEYIGALEAKGGLLQGKVRAGDLVTMTPPKTRTLPSG